MKIIEKVKKMLGKINVNPEIRSANISGTWVRGDGSRYTEFPYINTESKTTDIWDKKLLMNPHRLLEVSGEMGSDGYYPAMILRGVLYVKWKSCINYGSPSRLDNSDVWRSREVEK